MGFRVAIVSFVLISIGSPLLFAQSLCLFQFYSRDAIRKEADQVLKSLELQKLNDRRAVDGIEKDSPLLHESLFGKRYDQIDGISTYLNSLPKTLLTREEEIALGQALELARHLTDQRFYLLARNRFWVSNLKLVVSIAEKFRGRGVELEDLIQEGNFGLLEAIEKWDWRRGVKFSSFAVWWIRQKITLNFGKLKRTIQVPSHVFVKYQVIDAVRSELFFRHRVQPSIYEIYLAIQAGLYEEILEKNRRIRKPDLVGKFEIDGKKAADQRKKDFTFEAVNNILLRMDMIVPQHKLIDEDGVDFFENLLVRKEFNEMELILNSDLSRKMIDAIAHLSAREQKLIILRFGLFGSESYVRTEVAQMLGGDKPITQVRVAQIEKEAINKLKQYLDTSFLSFENLVPEGRQ